MKEKKFQIGDIVASPKDPNRHARVESYGIGLTEDFIPYHVIFLKWLKPSFIFVHDYYPEESFVLVHREQPTLPGIDV